MSLAATLAGLMAQAQRTGQTQQRHLVKGLYVRVAANPPRFLVWRDEGAWEPGETAEREAHICARHLGWGENYLLHWQGKYLVCTKAEGLLEVTG